MVDALGSACDLFEYDDGESVVYGLTQSLPAIGERLRCLVGIEVLVPAFGGTPLIFAVQVLDQENGYDPVPGNDSASLVPGAGEITGSSPFFHPHVEPENPTPADDIRWVAQWDGCGTLDPPTLTRWPDGLIEVRWPSWRLCGIPIGGGASFDLGPLPAGHYIVHVEPCQGPSFECLPITSPADVSFTVSGARAASNVPVLGTSAKITLGIGLLFLAMGALGLQTYHAVILKKSMPRKIAITPISTIPE